MRFHPFATLALVASLILGSAVPSNAACETVTTWDLFINLVNRGMNDQQAEVCFHPFNIIKPAGSTMILNRPIVLLCQKQSDSDECVIQGEGTQVRILGGNALVTLRGFSFVGATTAAIRIQSTSTKMHNVIDCRFNNNKGSNNGWRGGAIKTETGTSLTISSGNFDSNSAAGGGAIFHRGDQLVVLESLFTNNFAKEGGAIMNIAAAPLTIHDTTFTNNKATLSGGGAVESMNAQSITLDFATGSGNSPCNGVFDRATRTCEVFMSDPQPNTLPPAPQVASTPAPTPPKVPQVNETFRLGELSFDSMGFRMSTGLSIRRIGTAGQRIIFTSPQTSAAMSNIPFHVNPDGAAVFPVAGGGWIYMSNAENVDGKGGVYALEFDANGNTKDYAERLKGTTRNCSGGATPWGSWVSCEEFPGGQCWQVDPLAKRPPAKTKLVEPAGGNFESMAYDISDPTLPRFFVTEDHSRGAIRRFTPTSRNVDLSWDLIQTEGKIEYLKFNSDRTFQWTSSLNAGRTSAERYYPNVEGISYHLGTLSFVAKKQKEIFRLDLAKGTYTVASTNIGNLAGGGRFGAEPDQILQKEDYLYFTEDGGSNPGLYVSDGKQYFTLVEGRASVFKGDETTGIAFSPDGKRLYFCVQEIGYCFELSRDDGLPFPGQHVIG